MNSNTSNNNAHNTSSNHNNTSSNTSNNSAQDEEPLKEESKRPLLTKYSTIHNDKFPTVLTGDYGKNLIVEKARFDTPHHPPQPPTSTSTPLLPSKNAPEVDDINSSRKSPPLTTSITLPTVNTLQNNNTSTPSINTIPSQSTPLLTKTKPKADDRRSIKRKKLPPMSGSATPSEVFHRNLVDAVSNVEDSDENEQYVYPYSGNNTDTTYHMQGDPIHRTTSSLYRPQSTRSFIYRQPNQDHSRRATGFLGDLLRPILFNKSDQKQKTIHPQRSDEQLSRPKLRNYIMDHPYSHTTKSIPNDYFDNGKISPPYSRRSRKVHSNYMLNDGGYTTDDEEQQLLITNNRRNYRKPDNLCPRIFKNLVLGLTLVLILVFLLITYLAKPLKDLNVEMGRVLSSDKELIFDLHINAINSNLWTVHVADADISVFAFSQLVPMNELMTDYNDTITTHTDTQGVDPAEYLGGFYHFDEPLSFTSSFYSSEPVTAISQIRIKSPGADKSGNERWSRMIRYRYGLVVRGVLKYRPLSFLSPYPQSVAICDVVRVDPTTGKVSEDPDQGFCLSYDS
ncbi:hypothetical protein BDB01DRAFT_770079 [Pilobolus umbonatus]|nr:hypothetical protein BDB01DRAFT_770079 [Pilobolus umbonatus]